MSATTNHQDLDNIINPPKSLQSLNKGSLLFTTKLLIIVLVVLAFTEAMLYVNRSDLLDILATRRFASLQLISDRINDSLQQRRVDIITLKQLGLLSEQLDRDDDQLTNTQRMLSKLQKRISTYDDIALLDKESNLVVTVGNNAQFDIPKRALQTAAEALNSTDVYLSPLKLNTMMEDAYIWTMVRVKENNKKVKYLLINIHLKELWSSMYSMSYNEIPPLLLVDNTGQYIHLTEAGKYSQKPFNQRFPGLWEHMNSEGFGQFEIDNTNLIFMKVRPSPTDAVYLLSYIDDGTNTSLERRYRWQVRFIMVIVVVFFSLLLGLQRQQRLNRQATLRSTKLAEQLYQSNIGSMLFNSDGYCINVNQQLVEQLGIEATKLEDRRFSRLFHSDMFGIDVVWQMVKSSGYWHGSLQLTNQPDAHLRINLYSFNIEPTEPLVLLRLEESPQQREQAIKLTQFEQLSDSASGIALLDNHQQIINCNRAMATICKTPLDKLIGSNWQQLLPLHTDDMNQIIETQLAARGLWHSQIWIRRGDAAINRCLASIQVSELTQSDEGNRILTLTPIQDLTLCNDDDLTATVQRGNLGQLLRQNHNHQHSLMVLNIGNDAAINSFVDADQTLFRQYKILHQIAGALPSEAVIGNFSHPSEIQVLLPRWQHMQTSLLAANLLKLLDDADLGQQITIGLSQSDVDANWVQLLDDAFAAIERARMTGQRYCQAYTRVPKSPTS